MIRYVLTAIAALAPIGRFGVRKEILEKGSSSMQKFEHKTKDEELKPSLEAKKLDPGQ